MGRKKQAELPGVVGQVRERIARWRETFPQRSRLPEDLWEEAASLAQAHGVSPIARALGVGYESLRRRVARAGPVVRGCPTPSGGWVELDPGQLLGARRSSGAEVELVDAAGAKVMVRLAERDRLDLLGLAEAFWRRGR